MEQLNVIFREVKDGKFKGTIDCVLLDFYHDHYSNKIGCYTHIGQHSCGDFDYFVSNTKTTTPEKYNSLLNEIKSIYDSHDIVIHKKLTKKFLTR